MAISGVEVNGTTLCEKCHLYSVMSNKGNGMDKIGDNGTVMELKWAARQGRVLGFLMADSMLETSL